MKARKSIIPVPLSVACVLLCLVLLSTHFSSGMYARFATSASGSGSAKVAGFRVAAKPGTEENKPIQLTASETEGEYTVLISNSGTTAVRYLAELTTPDDKTVLPDYTIGDETENEKAENDGLTGTLAPGEEKTLTIKLDMRAMLGQGQTGGLDFQNDTVSGDSGEIPFDVIVTFTQIN